MIRYKATDEYAHFGEVYLINGKERRNLKRKEDAEKKLIYNYT